MSRDRIRRWEVTQRVGEVTTSLSFAVELVDAYTGGRPAGSPTVALADQQVVALENPSGYHLFLDLTADPVDVVVDGGDRYFDERLTVYHSTPMPDGVSGIAVTDRSTPVAISLTPTPAFQFSPGTTTIRGTVVDDTGDVVPDATVSLDGFTPTARTTGTGEFALLVPVTAADVVRDGDGKRVTAPGGSTGGPPGNGPPGNGPGNGPPGNGPGNGPTAGDETRPDPQLVVHHPDGSTADTDLRVDAGRLTVLRLHLSGGSLTVDRLGVY